MQCPQQPESEAETALPGPYRASKRTVKRPQKAKVEPLQEKGPLPRRQAAGKGAGGMGLRRRPWSVLATPVGRPVRP